jgi:thiol-disulfide isomerase/thioredoxin
MKKIALLFLTVFISSSYHSNTEKRYDVPQRIIVAGKIDNFDPNYHLTLHLERLGFGQEDILAKTDSAGNFMATFESFIPLDAWMSYKTNFLVLLHPSDSLYVRFDGKYDDRPELLETIRFVGKAARTNQFVAKFQQMYFSNSPFDWDEKQKYRKEYNPGQYLRYSDSIQQRNKKLYDQFVAENQPDDESKNWASLFIENDYCMYLGWYPEYHRELNNKPYSDTLIISKEYFESFFKLLPIDPSMFISASSLNDFSSVFNFYHDYYSMRLKDWKTDSTPKIEEELDSFFLFGTIEFITDPLLRQFLLSRLFNMKLESMSILFFEKYLNTVDTYIKEPFLKEPLQQKYLQTKQRIENPQSYTEAVLKEADNLSVNQVVAEILQQNKGKVIYVDFWGTWCGPCLAEMPNSKNVEHEFKDKDVAFVYICLESEEKQWKATLDKFQLGGQHYLLSNKQSGEMRKLFEITGVPFYVLIDKNGVIKEKGSHLRPLFARDKIKAMLE